MAINLKRNWRPAVAAIAAAGSLGLLHCNTAKQDTPLERRVEMNEPAPAPAEPNAVGGGPMAAVPPMPEATKPEGSSMHGISAVEQYLDGKGTEVNRFALEGLNYENACPYLTQEGIDSVDTLADLLNKHKDVKVSIESFTDDSGSDDANMQLSKRRAEVIKKQLVQCGVAPNRIETAGRGEENPIAGNDSDDGRARNRRTEVILHK